MSVSRKFLLPVTVLCMVFALVSCGGGNSSGPASSGTTPATAANVALPASAQPVAAGATSPPESSTIPSSSTSSPTQVCGSGTGFTVSLPGLSLPKDPATNGLPNLTLPDDSVTLPDGCDVYAILVHGYGRNGLFDELMFYKLAKWVAEHNGYVHWSWWNNFLGEYLSRPLHVIPGTARGDAKYPYPGDISQFENKLDFFARGGKGKAVPDDDYQFQSDVKQVLTQIRAHTPNAIVIVAGHSMGGNAVIRLGAQTTVPIDLLAPIDPVGNRNLPEGQGSSVLYGNGNQSAVPGAPHYVKGNETFNWTRWRATRDFQGWTVRDCVRVGLTGPCIDFKPLTPLVIDPKCVTIATGLDHLPASALQANNLCHPFYPNTVVKLPAQVHRLYYRWQQEAYFPFDWKADKLWLNFTGAPRYSGQPFDVRYHNYQRAVDEYTQAELPLPAALNPAPKTCRFPTMLDPSGAKSFTGQPLTCQDWDGHGEIIGMRGTTGRTSGGLPPTPDRANLNPLAATADWQNGWDRTSPWFPNIAATSCAPLDDSACTSSACRAAVARRAALICMAQPGTWPFAPKKPDLDLVVNDLVAIADDLWTQHTATPGGGPDTTPPVTTAVLDQPPTAYGWNNTDVTVTLTATDEDVGSGVHDIVYTLSGATTDSEVVDAASTQFTLSNEGTTAISYYAHDNAGNEESPQTLTVKIDKTPPVIDAGVNPPPNAAGWNNTDATVTFTATDALSGIDTVTAPVTLGSEGAGQEVDGVATDRAGNTASVGVIVNIDRTPPVISGLPGNCTLWPPNHKLVTVAHVVVDDVLSGVADNHVDATSSEPESGPTYGTFAPDVQISNGVVSLRAERYDPAGRTYDLNVTATDVAGNVAHGHATCRVPHDQWN